MASINDVIASASRRFRRRADRHTLGKPTTAQSSRQLLVVIAHARPLVVAGGLAVSGRGPRLPVAMPYRPAWPLNRRPSVRTASTARSRVGYRLRRPCPT
jgi:hypothetical protein